LLSIGWKYGAVAWYAEGYGSPAPVTPKKVDVNVTGVGGQEANNPGSFRYLYSNRAFDNASLGTATIEFSSYVKLYATGSDYETQFVIAGNGNTGGQIGVELHYQAGNDANFAQGRINVTNINFPANAGVTGQQYYSVNTSAPRIANGQEVKLQVKYFSSGYMQSFVNGVLVGQYKTSLIPSGGYYILHNYTNSTVVMRDIKVYKNGKDITKQGSPSFSNLNPTVTKDAVSGAYS